MSWDPAVYERFKDERAQPFHDLAALVVPRPGMRVVDLGCGTGELTRALHERLGASETVGLDSSREMLGKSASLAGNGLRFVHGAIESFEPEEPIDLVFSNAAIHWVKNHEELLRRFTFWLTPGGQLAVQVPAMDDQTPHAVAADVAREEPFASALAGWSKERNVLAPEAYAAILDKLGYAEQQVRLQVYPHRLPSIDAAVDWVKGTLLTAYREHLGEAMYASFLERYRNRLGARLGGARPVFFPYNRILFHARRSA